jgi:hypothetical protein
MLAMQSDVLILPASLVDLEEVVETAEAGQKRTRHRSKRRRGGFVDEMDQLAEDDNGYDPNAIAKKSAKIVWVLCSRDDLDQRVRIHCNKMVKCQAGCSIDL